MLDHITVRVADVHASHRLYNALLTELGQDPVEVEDEYVEWGEFGIAPANAERGVTTGHHIGLRAQSREQVDAFFARGVELGAEPDGEPGPRPEYGERYYGAFLRDPDGGSIEAVHDSGVGTEGVVDHMSLGVGDFTAQQAFGRALMPLVGWEVRADDPDRLRIGDGMTSAISWIDDGRPPTRGLHVGFFVETAAEVHEFHRALVAAGYEDDGGPGPRSEYSAGYYGAFVLDEDGNSYEAMTRVYS